MNHLLNQLRKDTIRKIFLTIYPGPITKSGVLFCFELRAFCSDIIQFSATFLVVVIRNLVKSFSKNAKKTFLSDFCFTGCFTRKQYQKLFEQLGFLDGFQYLIEQKYLEEIAKKSVTFQQRCAARDCNVFKKNYHNQIR